MVKHEKDLIFNFLQNVFLAISKKFDVAQFYQVIFRTFMDKSVKEYTHQILVFSQEISEAYLISSRANLIYSIYYNLLKIIGVALGNVKKYKN